MNVGDVILIAVVGMPIVVALGVLVFGRDE